MQEYQRDIFYDVDDLPFETKTKILMDAFAINTKWWADHLDCNVSIARQKVDMTFEEIMAKFTKKSLCCVIHRRGYDTHGEFGFRCMGRGEDYFLWIITTVEDLIKLTERYDLSPVWKD